MPEKNTLKLLCVLYLNKTNFIEYLTFYKLSPPLWKNLLCVNMLDICNFIGEMVS